MGRPCCDKEHIRKGPWSKEEDDRLVRHINANGLGCWRTLPRAAGLKRCGKSCRLRWINYLRPDVKRGNFTEQEDEVIATLHASHGNKWSLIAGRLPGRTDNEVKNYWNTYLKRRLNSTWSAAPPTDTAPPTNTAHVVPMDMVTTNNMKTDHEDNSTSFSTTATTINTTAPPTKTAAALPVVTTGNLKTDKDSSISFSNKIKLFGVYVNIRIAAESSVGENSISSSGVSTGNKEVTYPEHNLELSLGLPSIAV